MPCREDIAVGARVRVESVEATSSPLKNWRDKWRPPPCNDLIVVLALLLFVFITLAKGIRIVPQGEEWVIERSANITRPLCRPESDDPLYRRGLAKSRHKDVLLDVQEQEVITKDNAVILTNAIAFVKVTEPVKAVYGVVDSLTRSAI